MSTTRRIRLVQRTSNGTLQISESIHLQNKSGMNIRHSRFFLQTIQHTKHFLHRWTNSCRRGWNLCTTEYITTNPNIHTRKFTQGIIEIPSRDIGENQYLHQYLRGCQLGGHTKKNSNRWTKKKPKWKMHPNKSIHQCRTSLGTYLGGIPRVIPTISHSKND